MGFIPTAFPWPSGHLFKNLGLKTSSRLPELRRTLGEELRRVHTNYQPLLASLAPGLVLGAAHITGGGLTDNLPRITRRVLEANIRRGSWRIPPIFQILQRTASLNPAEMFSVFNMGLGMVLIVSKKREKEAVHKSPVDEVVGEIVEGSQTVVFVWSRRGGVRRLDGIRGEVPLNADKSNSTGAGFVLTNGSCSILGNRSRCWASALASDWSERWLWPPATDFAKPRESESPTTSLQRSLRHGSPTLHLGRWFTISRETGDPLVFLHGIYRGGQFY